MSRTSHSSLPVVGWRCLLGGRFGSVGDAGGKGGVAVELPEDVPGGGGGGGGGDRRLMWSVSVDA